MKFSQSFMRAVLDVEVCPAELKYKYIDKIPDRDENAPIAATDSMGKGRYFEWHLLGATRGGIEPIFKRNKNARYTTGSLGERIPNYAPEAQMELDELVEYARSLLARCGIEIAAGQTQLKIEVGDEEGHIDHKNKDFQNPTQDALYDVKWTATKYDDRWNGGWANFEEKEGERFQAIHYIMLHYKKYGVWVPFYFFVFGNSGWVRFIKVEITEIGVAWYNTTADNARTKARYFQVQGWPARPAFNKCIKCAYLDRCPQAARLPEIEIFKI